MIILDTHVWVWWVTEANPLPAKVRRRIDEEMANEAIYVSSISGGKSPSLSIGTDSTSRLTSPTGSLNRNRCRSRISSLWTTTLL